jgi:hypothetical protein
MTPQHRCCMYSCNKHPGINAPRSHMAYGCAQACNANTSLLHVQLQHTHAPCTRPAHICRMVRTCAQACKCNPNTELSEPVHSVHVIGHRCTDCRTVVIPKAPACTQRHLGLNNTRHLKLPANRHITSTSPPPHQTTRIHRVTTALQSVTCRVTVHRPALVEH